MDVAAERTGMYLQRVLGKILSSSDESGFRYTCLVQLAVVIAFGRNLFTRNAMRFTGPFTEIDQFAAFAAKRTVRIIFVPNQFFVTGRAMYVFFHRFV